MNDEELRALRIALKTGEYNGVNIMRSGFVIDELLALRAKHEVTHDALQRLYDCIVKHIKSEYEGTSMVPEITEQFDFAKDALK